MTAPSMWVAAAGGLVVELLRDLLPQLRARAATVYIAEAATRIAGAVRRAPIDKLPPQLQAAAHTELAEMMVAAAADLGGLSKEARERLHALVGRKLLRASAKKLDKAADDAIAATKRWEKALK